MALNLDIKAPTVRAPRDQDLRFASDGGLMPFEKTACATVLRVLNREYPGYAWVVYVANPMFRQDALVIRNLTCDPRGRWGFLFRMSAMSLPDAEIKIKRAGGEFLERYNVHRGAIREEEFTNRIMHFAEPEK